MQAAADITIAAFRDIHPRIREGMTPGRHQRALSSQRSRRWGATTDGGLILLGEASAYPHGSGKPQHVREGEVVLLDCGCTVARLSVRHFAHLRLRRAADGRAAQGLGPDAPRARRSRWQRRKVGAPAGSVDDAVRSAYESWGYGPRLQAPGTSHRTGHGIGMEGHEPVNLVHGETTPLAPGMCFSNEPGIYLPGKFGIRLEDCFHMTDGRPQVVLRAAAVHRQSIRLINRECHT